MQEQLSDFANRVDWDAMEDKYNDLFWDYMLSNEPKAHNEEWMLENYMDNFTDWVFEKIADQDVIFLENK